MLRAWEPRSWFCHPPRAEIREEEVQTVEDGVFDIHL